MRRKQLVRYKDGLWPVERMKEDAEIMAEEDATVDHNKLSRTARPS